jgi:hypothetical protein
VFEAMLDGWRNQQLARNLALSTITQRATRLRAFLAHADAFPWQWTPQQADEWFGDLRAVHGCARSSLRSGVQRVLERDPASVAIFAGHGTYRPEL